MNEPHAVKLFAVLFLLMCAVVAIGIAVPSVRFSQRLLWWVYCPLVIAAILTMIYIICRFSL